MHRFYKIKVKLVYIKKKYIFLKRRNQKAGQPLFSVA